MVNAIQYGSVSGGTMAASMRSPAHATKTPKVAASTDNVALSTSS